MTITVTHSTPADGSFSASGAIAWNASHTLSGTIDVANGGTGATTLTGVLKGNGTSAFSAATAGTDYQAPITLTTTGTSGAATFISNTLNIPQYSGGGGSGTVTSVGLTAPSIFTVTGSPVTTSGTLALSYSGTALPVANGGTNATSAGIASFNNITGYTASGATGTTSTNLVFSTSPAITTATLTNPTVTNYVETLYSANTSTAITVDLANGTVQNLTLTGNATITMPTAVAGKSFIIILSQDATGGRTVTWSTVSWPAATAPIITSTASKRDIFSFFSNGTSWFGTTIGQNYT
tara:strand:- start:824 stop:1708 length:885 start_codon:yes stop_codon:yes gene_type:complete